MVNLGNWFKKKFRSVEVREVVPINQQLTDRDNQIQTLSVALEGSKGEISRLLADKRRVDDKEVEIQQKNQFINDLIAKQNSIDQGKFKGALSLKTFFNYLDKKKNFKVSVMDRDMSEKMADFKDLIITREGELAIVDDTSTIISVGNQLNQVFFKPGSLLGQVGKGIMRLPCDVNWRANPDIEEQEMPECTYEKDTGKIKWSAIRTKPLKKLIQDREEKIGSLSVYVQQLEETSSVMHKDLEETKRDNMNLKKKVDIYRVDLSKINGQYIQMKKKFSDIKKRNAQLQSTNTFLSNMKSELETALEELGQSVSDKLAKEDYEVFDAKIKETVDWVTSKIVPVQQEPTPPKQNAPQ